MTASPISAVLLDRDGTVIADKHYLSDPAGVELLPGAAEGLRELASAGLRLFVVTNQSGIGRGYFSEADYRACHAALETLLRDEGISLSGSAFCPHAPEEGCGCRKPSLGMWRSLAGPHGLDPSRTAMVGDKAEDILFGRRAGFGATVLVLTGKGRDAAARLQLPAPGADEVFRRVGASADGSLPHAVARDLSGAAACILGQGPP
jgi:D-glycero-D-manno-heptose 1,7-bisphosphate phosphatase